MRYRLMATYRGVPYEAGIGPSDEDVVLFAACPPPEELGFEPATGHWRKQLRVTDVQALWESRPVGTFRGERCVVLDDLGDRLHIAYQGHDALRAEQLGYWEVDRGVFELVAPRDEISEIVEERLDYPGRANGEAPGLPAAELPAPEPARPVPPARGAPATGPHRTGPLPVVPNLTGPHAAVRNPAAADLTGPHAALRNSAAADRTGPHAAVPGARAPGRTGPLPAAANSAAPHMTGPLPAVPNSTGPPMTGPLPAVPNSTGPPMTGPLPAVPGPADSSPDLAVIPPSSEPPLPLEAAARRAASARVLQPGPVAEQAPAPPAAAQPAPPQPVPQPEPQAAARPAPPPREPESARARRAELRRQATRRIFSELAGLAAIPPSAYAVGEEVEGAMCLIQTPDGFEVFNAAGGARHEVRIFDDEESAYFYLFGVLAAEAVRTGRLAPQG
jgi:hypothetical protein